MTVKRIQKQLIYLLIHIALAAALDNGVARTPPMGFNNFMADNVTIIGSNLSYIADFLESSGLQKLGYIYINTDEGWELPDRHPDTGELQENPKLFPQGLAQFIQSLHERGFKFGIYGAASAVTCGILPGQLYHERQDARTYALTWKVDYVKSDNCANFAVDSSVRYRAMRDALNATGRPLIFSIEPFSITPDPTLSSQVANLWRTGNDIQRSFQSILDRVDIADKWAPLAGPNLGWNDPDYVHVQNPPGLSLGQNRIYFGLWSIMKAPLLLSADLPMLHPSVLKIISNSEVIAVNQDPLGIPARKFQVNNEPLPWLVGVADCALTDGSLGYSRNVAQDKVGPPRAGPGTTDLRRWTLIAVDEQGKMKEKYNPASTAAIDPTSVLIQHDATGRCLAVMKETRVVLLPYCPTNDERFLWRFEKGTTTVTSITNLHTQKALALADSFLYARRHGKDRQNVTDLAYDTNKLILVDPVNQESCDSRYCENYDPAQMWYFSSHEKTLQHSLYTASMNHIENYRDKTHEDGWALTPKVPTFRRNCLAHILSEDNTGTEAGGHTEVWGGPIEGDNFVVGLVNRGTSVENITARIDLLLETSGRRISHMGETFSFTVDRIRDLWKKENISLSDVLDSHGDIQLKVPPHDISLLKLHIHNGEAISKQ